MAATGLPTPALERQQDIKKERDLSQLVSIFPLCRLIAYNHIFSAMSGYHSFISSSSCKKIHLILFIHLFTNSKFVCLLYPRFQGNISEQNWNLNSVYCYHFPQSLCSFVCDFFSGSFGKEKKQMCHQSTIFTPKSHGQAKGLLFCLGYRNMSERTLGSHD